MTQATEQYELHIFSADAFLRMPVTDDSFVFGDHKKSIDRVHKELKGLYLRISSNGTRWSAEVNKKKKVYIGGQPVTGIIDDICNILIVLDIEKQVAIFLTRVSKCAAYVIDLFDIYSFTVGRNRDNNLILNHPHISGHHTLLIRREDGWYISDQQSANGTWTEGRKVINEMRLPDDRTVFLLQFSFHLHDNRLYVYGTPPQIGLHFFDARRKDYPYVSRSPRFIEKLPEGSIEIEAAPDTMAKPQINWLTVLLPSLGSFAAMMLMARFIGSNATMALFMLPMAVISLLVAIINYRGQVKKYKKEQSLLHTKYEAYLEEKDQEIAQIAQAQHDILNRKDPHAALFRSMIEKKDRMIYSRSPQDDDFMSLRIGCGEVHLCVQVQTPKLGFVLQEKEYRFSPVEIADRYRTVNDLPVYCNFLKTPTVGIVGEDDLMCAAAHQLILQTAFHHSYEECKIVIIFRENQKELWSWARWLPHTYDESRTMRYMASSSYDAAGILKTIEEELRARSNDRQETYSMRAKSLQIPFYLFVIAAPELLDNHPITRYLLGNDTMIGVGCVILGGTLKNLPLQTMSVLEANGEHSRLYEREKTTSSLAFSMDPLSMRETQDIARHFAPLRLPDAGAEDKLPSVVSFLDGYHVSRPEELEIGEFWQEARPEMTMSVPIGVRTNGENFNFDINEKAHGSHGLVAGTNGSGKTEMIQSWILSMAVQFSPQDVSFVLIDFKGTGLILPLKDLPHLAGSISDLDTNISRNLVALRAELQRRKELFDRSNCVNISSYLKLYREGKVSEPLSYLFIVIDEYAEFKANFPEFTEEVNSLFRTGRSLGVHIILMTQNPSGIISAQAESNVRFRWCLRVASTMASKEVLPGHDEAARIRNPGRAYISVGTDEVFELIQSYYSGGKYEPDKPKKKRQVIPPIRSVALNGSKKELVRDTAGGEKKYKRGTEIEAVVNFLRDYTARRQIRPARQIWTQKIPDILFLDDILKGLPEHDDDTLSPVVGLYDDPALQQQYPLAVPLSENGHAVIYGGPGAGKSTFLHTMISSVCQSYTPEEVNLYLLDFGSWTMGMFRDYPHVGAVANDNEAEKTDKIIRLIDDGLSERRTLFSSAGVGSIKAYNSAANEKLPYLLLVIDNFAPVLELYSQYDDFFMRLVREGGSYGVLLVSTANTANGLGFRLQQNIRTNIALQMPDASDYASIVGRTDGLYPDPFVGRGLYRTDRVVEFQTALPGNTRDDNTRNRQIRERGAQYAAAWNGKTAKRPAILPDEIAYGRIHAQDGVTLGIYKDDMQPVGIVPEAEHTLLISGKTGAGKTNLLQVIVRQLQKRGKDHIRVCGKHDEWKNASGDLLFSDITELDRYAENLSEELKRRNALSQEELEKCDHIWLILDDVTTCYGEMRDDTANRLQALVQIGEGLGVILIAAGNNMELNKNRGMIPMLDQMAKGRCILLGGSERDHMLIDTPFPDNIQGMTAGVHEGFLITDGTVRAFKAMKAS